MRLTHRARAARRPEYRYQFTNCTLAPLVNTLQADRPILDKTGLTGRYDITMFATPDFKLRNSSEPGDISPLDAVRNLGLKLEPKKNNIEVIVVDHVEKPSENLRSSDCGLTISPFAAAVQFVLHEFAEAAIGLSPRYPIRRGVRFAIHRRVRLRPGSEGLLRYLPPH